MTLVIELFFSSTELRAEIKSSKSYKLSAYKFRFS